MVFAAKLSLKGYLYAIREACNNDTKLLNGIVKIDETYIGGKEANKHKDKKIKGSQGRSTKSKVAVVGLKHDRRELQPRDGEVKAKAFDKVNSNTIQEYIDDNVSKGSTLSTDEAIFYKSIKNYTKIRVNHSAKEYVNKMASTNGIESVWAVLKRGYYGTWHKDS